MSSFFDSAVHSLRKHAPFANPSILHFMKEAVLNNGGDARLTIDYRPAVATRIWWQLEWTDQKGEHREVSAQELNLCAWRAIQTHKNVARQIELEDRPVTQGPGIFNPSAAGWEHGDGI